MAAASLSWYKRGGWGGANELCNTKHQQRRLLGWTVGACGIGGVFHYATITQQIDTIEETRSQHHSQTVNHWRFLMRILPTARGTYAANHPPTNGQCRIKPSSFPPSDRSIDPVVKLHNPHTSQQLFQILGKSSMHRVLLHIIIAILDLGKLDHEAVSEAPLSHMPPQIISARRLREQAPNPSRSEMVAGGVSQ